MSESGYCPKHFISYSPDLSRDCPYCRIAELEATIKRVEEIEYKWSGDMGELVVCADAVEAAIAGEGE